MVTQALYESILINIFIIKINIKIVEISIYMQLLNIKDGIKIELELVKVYHLTTV